MDGNAKGVDDLVAHWPYGHKIATLSCIFTVDQRNRHVRRPRDRRILLRHWIAVGHDEAPGTGRTVPGAHDVRGRSGSDWCPVGNNSDLDAVSTRIIALGGFAPF